MTTPSPDEPPPRCRAEVDLGALRHNADLLAKQAGSACGLMAIVKADAYGHGLPEVVAALAGKVGWFGVANFREARRARKAVGEHRVEFLILSPAAPEEVESVVADGFSGSVSLPEEVDAYAAAAAKLGTVARLHAVVDTGMGRMGAQPDDFPGLVERIRQNPSCRLEGIASHFPSADEDEAFTRDQIARFRRLLEAVRPEPGCHVHLGNSAGLLGFQDKMPFATLARPGLALYGISPLAKAGVDLQPVLSLKTRVTLVRDLPAGAGVSYGRTFVTDRPTRVATLAAGYGDGYPRHLSGQGASVLIGGKRCSLLGRVTMDQILVDVSEAGEVKRGDEAVLIGRQGGAEITVAEIAEKAGTIPWEILTGFTSRVVRVYR